MKIEEVLLLAALGVGAWYLLTQQQQQTQQQRLRSLIGSLPPQPTARELSRAQDARDNAALAQGAMQGFSFGGPIGAGIGFVAAGALTNG